MKMEPQFSPQLLFSSDSQGNAPLFGVICLFTFRASVCDSVSVLEYISWMPGCHDRQGKFQGKGEVVPP